MLEKELRNLTERELPLALVPELAAEAAALLEIQLSAADWYPATAKKLLDFLGDEGLWSADDFHHVRLVAQQRLLNELDNLAIEETQVANFSQWSAGDRAKASQLLRDSSVFHIYLPYEIKDILKHLSNTTGLSDEALLRFALCLSLKMTEKPDVPAEQEDFYTVSISQVFGQNPLLYMALLEARRIKDQVAKNERKMLITSHFSRGILCMKSQVKSLMDLIAIMKENTM